MPLEWHGVWDYYAGVAGTVVVAPTHGGRQQRILGIGCHASAAGSFTINGGQSVPVPAGVAVNVGPIGQLFNPTLVFTGTDTYFVEVVEE